MENILKKIGLTYEELLFILNKIPLNIIITDGDGSILWVNECLCEFTGYSFEELIVENPRILKCEQTDPNIYDELWDTIKRKRKIWKGRLKNKKKNGEIYEEDIKIIPIKNGRKNPSKFIGIQHDITELEKLRKREKVKDALQKTLEKIEKIHKSI
jgi:PAS domain S-box-containing protein